MVAASGSIFYRDSYEQQYFSDWETSRGLLDITTITKQPYRWGMAAEGYVQNRTLFKRGIITVHRQVLEPLTTGYRIVAEGINQYVDYIPMNFPCVRGPTDHFRHHLNCALGQEVTMSVTAGPRWTDPDVGGDDEVLWGSVNPDGSVVESPSSGITDFSWLDVWSSI